MDSRCEDKNWAKVCGHCCGHSGSVPDMRTWPVGSLFPQCSGLAKLRVLGGRPAQALELLWVHIRTVYKNTGTTCRLSHLKLSMLENAPFPRLKAKANETKHLLWPVATVLEGLKGNDEDLNQMWTLVMLSYRLDQVTS